jgi:hypothetical protein
VPKSDPSHSLDDYSPVAERIVLFYQRFPLGRVITRLVEHTDDVVIVQASVYRSPTEKRPSSTGWAAERPSDGEINTVACLENTETSAIGRALANLGLGPGRQPPDPSRADPWRHGSAATLESLGVRTIYGGPRFYPARPRSHLTSDLPHESPPRAPEVRRAPPPIVRDLLRLLDDAERCGMRPRRAAAYKLRLETDRCPEAQLERLERALRHWVSAARERRVGNAWNLYGKRSESGP